MPQQCFNSHATRGNSPPASSVSRLYQYGFNSHATRGNSPREVLGMHEMAEVSIPMLRAGIHKKARSQVNSHSGFNSHATRGNSPRAPGRRRRRMVSIPMLRAGIHRTYDEKGNSNDVSIPMLRAGIHMKNSQCTTQGKFQFP